MLMCRYPFRLLSQFRVAQFRVAHSAARLAVQCFPGIRNLQFFTSSHFIGPPSSGGY